MKKVVFTIALLAFAITANAQWNIGGQIGLGHNGTQDDNYTPASRNTATFAFSPKIGYQFDNWQVGATLMLGFDKSRVYYGAKDNYSMTTNLQYGIAPYARYTFGSWNKWSLFVEGQFVLGMSPESTTYTYANGKEVTSTPNNDEATFINLSVVPGMNLKFSDHFSMDFYLNIAKLNFNMLYTKAINSHDCYIGGSFNQQSLNDYFNLFGVGFNYMF